MALLFIAPALVWAQTTETRPAAKAITGPDAVDNQLDDDREENPNLLDTNLLKSWEDWKADIADRSGLSFGLDYNALGFAATDSLGDDTSASGAFRLFGTWDFFGRGTKNTGGIVFKVEHRHDYSDVAPSQFGSELGYAGSITPVFSDQGWRTTHLHWRQGFSDGRGVAYAGFLDVTDYVDVYALASPWTAFSNLAFETGSGTIGAIPDGAFGAMVGGFISGNIYAIGGIADANGDATDLTGEFDSFFDDFETFKSLEFGWTSSRKNEPALFLNNFHVTFWQSTSAPRLERRTDGVSPFRPLSWWESTGCPLSAVDGRKTATASTKPRSPWGSDTSRRAAATCWAWAYTCRAPTRAPSAPISMTSSPEKFSTSCR